MNNTLLSATCDTTVCALQRASRQQFARTRNILQAARQSARLTAGSVGGTARTAAKRRLFDDRNRDKLIANGCVAQYVNRYAGDAHAGPSEEMAAAFVNPFPLQH